MKVRKHWVVASIVIAAVAVFYRVFLQSADWNAIAALSTASAALVALWLGLRDGIRREDERAAEEVIVLAVIQADLGLLLPRLRRIYEASSWLGVSEDSTVGARLAYEADRLEVRGIGSSLYRLGVISDGRGRLAAHIWAVLPALITLCRESGSAGSSVASSRGVLAKNQIRSDIEQIAYNARELLGGKRGHRFMAGLEHAANAYVPDRKVRL